MTHSEAHILLDQKFDKLGTDQYDDLEVEEKDLWLYEGVMSFLKERTKPQPYWRYNFQETKAQYDNLENLVSSVELPLVIVDDSTLKAELPADYFMAIREEVKSFVCPSSTANKTTGDKSFVVLPWPDDNRGDRDHNYYGNFRIAILEEFFTFAYIYSESLFPAYETGVKHPDLYYMVVRHFIERQNVIEFLNYKVYWEWYDGNYYPNSLIVENNTGDTIYSGWLFFDGISAGTIGAQTEAYEKYDTLLQKGSRYTAEARLVVQEELRNILNNEMFTTSYDSPIVTMKERNLYVHHSSKFVPEKLTLTYLRKPKVVDVKSKTFTEIDAGFHSDIINETVEQLTAAIAADTHNLIKQDNFNNE